MVFVAGQILMANLQPLKLRLAAANWPSCICHQSLRDAIQPPDSKLLSRLHALNCAIITIGVAVEFQFVYKVTHPYA